MKILAAIVWVVTGLAGGILAAKGESDGAPFGILGMFCGVISGATAVLVVVLP